MAKPTNIVLLGFMGAGKSSVAKELARTQGFTHVDTDDLIVKNQGKTIPEIFAQEGEKCFRQYEMEAVAEAGKMSGRAIATGGGVILNECNVEALAADGMLVYLYAPIEQLLARVLSCQTVRPLAKNEEQFKKLFFSRVELYEKLPQKVDTTGLSIEETAQAVIALYRRLGGIAPHGCPW